MYLLINIIKIIVSNIEPSKTPFYVLKGSLINARNSIYEKNAKLTPFLHLIVLEGVESNHNFLNAMLAVAQGRWGKREEAPGKKLYIAPPFFLVGPQNYNISPTLFSASTKALA